MLKYATVALCAVPVVACQKSDSPAGSKAGPGSVQPKDMRGARVNVLVQPVPEFLGSELGPDGTVSKESTSIPAGKPVYGTMLFRESPKGLAAIAVWATIDKKAVSAERKEMNGSKIATFALSGKTKPGRYKVAGYWGGNITAEREFEITSAAKGERKKG